MPHGRPAKRRRVTPPIDDSIPSETIKSGDLLARTADWDLEQEYEQRSRTKKTKESSRLPVITADGRIQQKKHEKLPELDGDSDSFLGSGSENEDGDGDEEAETLPRRQSLFLSYP